jgi:hypothetical protein
MHIEVSPFFAATKVVEGQIENVSISKAIFDLTKEFSGWDHKHDIKPYARKFRLAFSEEMRERISKG